LDEACKLSLKFRKGAHNLLHQKIHGMKQFFSVEAYLSKAEFYFSSAVSLEDYFICHKAADNCAIGIV
jgi:hypothetical protein